MKYDYYKNKYQTITIKLDRNKDRVAIDFFKSKAAEGKGPKYVICELIAREIMAGELIKACGLFKLEDDTPEV